MIRALRLVLYLLVTLVVIVGLVLVFIATPPGRAVVASLVERMVAGSGLTLSIDRLSGWPPFAFGADRIVIGDSEGTFAEIDGLSVDLAIGGLLRREIVFDSLSAERVAVLRQPVLTPSQGGGDSAALAFAAHDFSIGQLELGEALVGHAAVLAVNGAFSSGRDGSLSARLDARRTDGRAGIVTATLDRASGSAPMMIDATVEEGADGILVGMMGRDSGPAYRLEARTGLDDGALDGNLTLTSDGNARFAGRFALAPSTDGGQHLTLDGEGDLAELVPPGFATLLSGAIRVAVDVDWRQAPGDALPRVAIRDARLDTGAVRAQASGSFGSADSDLTLRVQVSNPAGGGFALPLGGDAPLAFESIDLSGRVAPVDGMTRLDLIGRIAGLSAADVSVPATGLSLAIEADGANPLADTTLPFAFRAEADSIGLAGHVIPGGDDSPIVVTAQGTIDLAALSGETTAEVTFARGRLTYSGNIGAEAVTGRVEADYEDVATVAGLFDQPLRGRLSASAEGRFAGGDGLDVRVAVRTGDLDTGIAALAPLLGPDVTVAGTITDTADGRIAVTDLSVAGSEVSLSGKASLDGATVDATLTGRIADLGVLADATSGAADLEARVTGDLSAPEVDATIRVATGALLDQPVEDASVRIAGAPVESGWQGTLTLGGTLAGQPLSGTATALAGASGLTLPSIDLTIAENRITGGLEQTADGLFTGSLDIAAPDLATLAAVALVEASGALNAKATLSAGNGRQDLAVRFGGDGIAVEGITVGHLEGEANVADLLGVPAITGRADLGAIAVGSLVIDTAMLSASVVDGATEFKASAAGPDLQLAGAGSLAAASGATTVRIDALKGAAFGFPVDLAAPATIAIADGVTRLSDVALSAGGGEIRVAGAVSPELDVAVEIASVAASFVNAIVPGLEASGTISGTASVTGTPDAPAFQWSVNWADFAVAAADSIGLPPLTVTASGKGDLEGTTVDARATGGGLDLTASGNVPFGGDEGVRIDVAGNAEALDLGQPALAGLLSGETTLSATVTTGADGKLAVSDIAIGGTGLNLTGDISLVGDAIDATVDGRIADLSALAPDSTGAAEFNARISGSLAKPDVDATVLVPEGMILGQSVEGASVNFKGAPTDQGGWEGALALGGAFAGNPLSGTAQAALAANGGLTLPEVDLRVGENRITGAISRTEAGLLNGSLDISAPNLATLAALALVEATGTAQARVVFAPDNGRQSVSASISGANISMPSIVVGHVEGDVQIEDALGVPMVRGSAEASGVDIGGTRIDTARVTATVENGATEFQASARGPDLDLTGAGSLAADGTAQVVRLARLSGSAFGFPVNLAAPATVRMDGGETTLSDVSLAVGGGRIAVAGSVGTEIAVDAVIDQVAGAFIDRFADGLGAEGVISGRATVSGTPAAPRAQWRIDWTGFNVAAARNAGVPAMNLNASGVASASATTVDAKLAGGGVSLAITGNVPYAGSGLQVRAQGTAPVALVSAQLGNDIAADGTARIDLAVIGSAARPLINGTFDLVEVRVADASDGIGVAGLNGRITFDGSTARIERMTGRLTQGGNLSVAGTIGVNPAAGIPANLTIRIADGRYLDGVMVNANFNANLTLVGPLAGGATIAGVINLGRTEILLPDSFGGGPPITVEHIRTAPGFVPPMATLGNAGVAQPSGGSGGGTGGFNLGLAINSNNAIYVRGFGLDAELGGSLRVEGTTANPVPVGGFQLRRGRIEVLGRRLDFDRGVVTFQGDFDPVLDFVATTRTADIVAAISVEGPANDPEIALASVPSLPEEEIIARILFGKSIGSLSAFQALQLVDAVASFSGAFGRDGGVFSRVRRLVGVDDLDVQQNATGGTTIGIGKRLSDNLRVGVQTDTDGTSSIKLDVDLTKNLKAQIEGGADGSGSVGLTFEKEY